MNDPDVEDDIQPGTATLDDARAHARAQADRTAAPVTIPSTAALDLPGGVTGADVIWDETIAVGGYASRPLPRSAVLRLADRDGDGCVQLLVFDAANPAERLNVADTVKVQWQAYLGLGAVLLSDMGRALMTIVHDTSARHDCLCGASTAPANATRYGDGSASGPTPSGRDLLCLGAMKLGLSRADVGPSLNLFKSAIVGEDGSLRLDGADAPARGVELRTETDVLVVIANSPHPLDDREVYTGSPIRITARRSRHPEPDPFRGAVPERERAYLNEDELRRSRTS